MEAMVAAVGAAQMVLDVGVEAAPMKVVAGVAMEVPVVVVAVVEVLAAAVGSTTRGLALV